MQCWTALSTRIHQPVAAAAALHNSALHQLLSWEQVPSWLGGSLQPIGECGLAVFVNSNCCNCCGVLALSNEAGQVSWVDDLQWNNNSSREPCGLLMYDFQADDIASIIAFSCQHGASCDTQPKCVMFLGGDQHVITNCHHSPCVVCMMMCRPVIL